MQVLAAGVAWFAGLPVAFVPLWQVEQSVVDVKAL
jgi:hypothetical protein